MECPGDKELWCHVQNPFIAQDRPSRGCSPPQPQCSLAQQRVGGRQGKVSPGGATRCANLVHIGRRRRGRGALRSPAIAPGRRAQKCHLLRTRRRCQMKIITLKSRCFSRKKIALMGFARNEQLQPFGEKTLSNISRLQRRENANHPPHSKPITHAHAHAGQQSSLRRKCISLADRASGPSAAAHSREARLTPPPRPPASPSPSHPAPAATARGTCR